MASGVDRRELWAELASIYDATRTLPDGGDEVVAAVLARELRARGTRRILDLGCGTGRWAAPLAAAGLGVVGIDRSPEMLAAIGRKPGGSGVRVVRGDGAALPFAREFDAVVMSHFLHLLPSLAPIARELGRVLRPGALLVTIDPSFLPRPLGNRITALALERLAGRAPKLAYDDSSREQLLLEALARAVGAGPTAVVPAFETVLVRSARDHLDGVRQRVWSVYRTYPASAAAAAADAVERTLLDEGVDLDAPRRERLGVRLLLASLSR